MKHLNAIKSDVEAYYDIKINKIYDNSPIMKLQELIYKQIQKSLHFTIADEILNKLPEVTFARFVSRSQTIATTFLHVPLSSFIKLNDQEYEDNLLLTIVLPPVLGNLCAICNSSLRSSLLWRPQRIKVLKAYPSKVRFDVRKRCNTISYLKAQFFSDISFEYNGHIQFNILISKKCYAKNISITRQIRCNEGILQVA